MAETDPTLASVIGAQLSCGGCPLRVSGPVAIYIPLHMRPPLSLLVFDHPYSDTVTPADDPRRHSLLALVPELARFAVTYIASCWTDPGLPIPERSVDACQRHRAAELASLHPPIIVTVGEQACFSYTGHLLEQAAGQVWQHVSGALVVPLATSDKCTSVEVGPIRQLCQGSPQVSYDLL